LASKTDSVSVTCGINLLILSASASLTAAPEIACVKKVVVLSILARNFAYFFFFF